MRTERLAELIYEALETEMGGVNVWRYGAQMRAK
jgi:tRNA threonylcarbamoyladenosine modification (KEOPS) complex  Pcc1 subunit